jgi:BirA family biotin operon repressor/biotin-[acetyl-CoA-carboxylase] ligase
MSVVLRGPGRMLPLAAAVAVAETAGPGAAIKWPNDVLLDGRKLAGILVEGRPQEGWAVLGIGINVALRVGELPAELRDRASTLGLQPADVDAVLGRLLARLEGTLALPPDALLAGWRRRDALLGRPVSWDGGHGTGAGVDQDGRLLVDQPDGTRIALDAGEVHLGSSPRG